MGGRGAHRDGGDDEARWERLRFRPLGPEPQPEGKARVRAADGGGEGGAVEEAEERERDDGRREEGRECAPAKRATSACSPALRQRRRPHCRSRSRRAAWRLYFTGRRGWQRRRSEAARWPHPARCLRGSPHARGRGTAEGENAYWRRRDQ